MPYNIVVLSVEPVLDNPIALAICSIGLVVVFICLFLFILFGFLNFWWDFESVQDIISNIGIMCLLVTFVFALFDSFEYHDTGLKRYSVIAQTQEQIEYIYNNYDIVDSDGDIYYIEERNK